MKMTHNIFLALGTNIGDKELNIKKAVELLKEKIDGMVLAPLYESKPKDYIDQDNFINTAVQGNTKLSPQKLLIFVKNIEQKLGRIKRIKNGPREIDVDILFYDNLVLNTPDLIIPHPRIIERDFVLRPLADLDENFIHPIFNVSVGKLLDDLKDKSYIIK